ncbi:MAG: hypothetical protein ABR584_01045 [Candidatus Baltobacteraceae bacterium]
MLTAGAIIALAVWPLLTVFNNAAPAASVTPAPVLADYLGRSRTIALEEKIVGRDKFDQILRRSLASQYLQRFREQGDIGDVARAQNMAGQSIALQPQLNTGARLALASAYLNYHNFTAALKSARLAYAAEQNALVLPQEASILMELGRYAEAEKILSHPPNARARNPAWEAVQVRYDELTGRLADGRRLLAQITPVIDANLYAGAYDRSWYHMRAAQLAFEAGDDTMAQAEFDESLRIFPNNYMALLWEARFYRAHKQWREALAAATRSADFYPLPQTLGYKADAQRALGDTRGAEETDALIRAEQRLFNVQGVNDRLLANYYAQRHVHLDDALRAAMDDYKKRGDEVYADDTMAWTLAARGDWQRARFFAARATRWNTEDSEVQYHAGIIAAHTNRKAEAVRRLQAALAANPQFDAFDADDARAQLAALKTP